MGNNEKKRLSIILSFQPMIISENDMLNEIQTKVENCKLQLSQQPSLTSAHITSLIIFNIYTDVHKIHSKRRFFFLLLVSQHIWNPLVHSKPSKLNKKRTQSLYINKNKCSLWASVFVPGGFSLAPNRCFLARVTKRCVPYGCAAISQFQRFTFQSTSMTF